MARRTSRLFLLVAAESRDLAPDADLFWQVDVRVETLDSIEERAWRFFEGRSPRALFAARELIVAASGNRASGLRRERTLFPGYFVNDDRREGISAFLARRKPLFFLRAARAAVESGETKLGAEAYGQTAPGASKSSR